MARKTRKTRYYKVYTGSTVFKDRLGSPGELSVDIYDFVDPFMEDMMKKYPKINRSALHSTALGLMREMKKDLRKGKAGNTTLPKLSKIYDPKIRALVQRHAWNPYQHLLTSKYPGTSKRQGSKQQRLVNAIGYDIITNPHAPKVGFTSKSAINFGIAVQGGYRGGVGSFKYQGKQPITAKMSRKFAAMGFYGKPSKSTLRRPNGRKQNQRQEINTRRSIIYQPKRPMIKPMFEHKKEYIGERYAFKFEEKLKLRLLRGKEEEKKLISKFLERA